MEYSPGWIISWATNQALVHFLKNEIISNIFFDQNTMELEITYRRKKTVKNRNTWMLNNLLLNNQWIAEEIEEEIENT